MTNSGKDDEYKKQLRRLTTPLIIGAAVPVVGAIIGLFVIIAVGGR
ncbi:hypothetical protein GW746_00415 [Candidatus Saccharibacteria bacterium]|nr:hypothetical protein [Candidatus Saccharibacteria bacterium]NCS82868.1 hypothetical protein [Candidatus Saccharibacteria bacterium]